MKPFFYLPSTAFICYVTLLGGCKKDEPPAVPKNIPLKVYHPAKNSESSKLSPESPPPALAMEPDQPKLKKQLVHTEQTTIPKNLLDKITTPLLRNGHLELATELHLSDREAQGLEKLLVEKIATAKAIQLTRVDSGGTLSLQVGQELRFAALTSEEISGIQEDFASSIPENIQKSSGKLIQFLFNKQLEDQYGQGFTLTLVETTASGSSTSLYLPRELRNLKMIVSKDDGKTETLSPVQGKGSRFDFVKIHVPKKGR
jgi:hypothetical protein